MSEIEFSTQVVSGSIQHLTKISRCFSAENLAPHRRDAISKLSNVSFAPPNCTDPLVNGEMILWRCGIRLLYFEYIGSIILGRKLSSNKDDK